MFLGPAQDYSDLVYQLATEAYWDLVAARRPPGEKPRAMDRLRHGHAAIGRIADLAPGNSAEAQLAAKFVVASEQWKDQLQLAQEPKATQERAFKCRAQALRMMRQANSALRQLLHMQETRKLRRPTPVSDRPACCEPEAVRLVTSIPRLRGHGK
jgi:hypothetical protein